MGMWKEIRREAHLLKQDCNFILGDGGCIRFWEDRWCGSDTLCDLYPTLYALANSKRATVKEVWDTSSREGGWNVRFFRPFNDWEMEEAQRFINLISSRKIVQRERDKIFWKVDKRGQYSIRACYRQLEGGVLNSRFPIGLIWNSCVAVFP